MTIFKRPIGDESDRLFGALEDAFVEVLLGRKQVRLEEDAISAKLKGKVVLVTGAAGSIGFELCRQVARFRPSAIVGFDIAETALFHLDREMRGRSQRTRFHAALGSILNARRLDEIFAQYHPSIVYHAAGYKHVSMMETQIFEAIENNVLGTYHVLAAAAEYGTEDFVLLSSDKAVSPASIMGATKRLAELVILSTENNCTKYVSVRFGNVLGSGGSVLPLFLEQIAAGGPVTVTHPEMRRYFMTAREAAQLVLQASTLGRGREIFVLDMGEPLKIVELARNLIRFFGLRPDGDIQIEFTGVRAGEKLEEETILANEEMLPTFHEKIRIIDGHSLPENYMLTHLAAMRGFCRDRDLSGLLSMVRELVPSYDPSAEVLRQVSGARILATADRCLAGAVTAGTGRPGK